MDSVPDIVAGAVAAGAAASLGDTANHLVTDAYATVKSLIARRYAMVDLTSVEQRPQSRARRDMLSEALADAGAAGDVELLAATRQLIAIVRDREASAGARVGVDLQRIHAAALKITKVESPDIGVRVFDSHFDDAIEIEKVQAGPQGPPDPSRARR